MLDDDGKEVPDGTVGLLGGEDARPAPRATGTTRALTGVFRAQRLVADRRRGAARRATATSTTSTGRPTSSTPPTGPVYSLPLEEVLIADCAELVQDCSVVGVPAVEQGAGRSPSSSSRPPARERRRDDPRRANKELASAGLDAARRGGHRPSPRTSPSARPARCSSASCEHGTPAS